MFAALGLAALTLSKSLAASGDAAIWLVVAMLAVAAAGLLLAAWIWVRQGRRARARLAVEIQNLGNTAAQYEIRAESGGDPLHFRFGFAGQQLAELTHPGTGQATGAHSSSLAWSQTPAVQPGESLRLELLISPAARMPAGTRHFSLHSRALEAPDISQSHEQGSVLLGSTSWQARFVPSAGVLLVAFACTALIWVVFGRG